MEAVEIKEFQHQRLHVFPFCQLQKVRHAGDLRLKPRTMWKAFCDVASKEENPEEDVGMRSSEIDEVGAAQRVFQLRNQGLQSFRWYFIDVYCVYEEKRCDLDALQNSLP
jgi:hypothetical protein